MKTMINFNSEFDRFVEIIRKNRFNLFVNGGYGLAQVLEDAFPNAEASSGSSEAKVYHGCPEFTNRFLTKPINLVAFAYGSVDVQKTYVSDDDPGYLIVANWVNTKAGGFKIDIHYHTKLIDRDYVSIYMNANELPCRYKPYGEYLFFGYKKHKYPYFEKNTKTINAECYTGNIYSDDNFAWLDTFNGIGKYENYLATDGEYWIPEKGSAFYVANSAA